MASKKEEYVERLEKQIRELKSENRQLQKRLRRISKGYRKFLDREDEPEAEVKPNPDDPKPCWACGGDYRVIYVGKRRWRQCQECGKRGKVTILSDEE